MWIPAGGYVLGKEKVDLESEGNMWEPVIWLAGVEGDWRQ